MFWQYVKCLRHANKARSTNTTITITTITTATITTATITFYIVIVLLFGLNYNSILPYY